MKRFRWNWQNRNFYHCIIDTIDVPGEILQSAAFANIRHMHFGIDYRNDVYGLDYPLEALLQAKSLVNKLETLSVRSFGFPKDHYTSTETFIELYGKLVSLHTLELHAPHIRFIDYLRVPIPHYVRGIDVIALPALKTLVVTEPPSSKYSTKRLEMLGVSPWNRKRLGYPIKLLVVNEPLKNCLIYHEAPFDVGNWVSRFVCIKHEEEESDV